MAAENVKYGIRLFRDADIHLFREGRPFHLYEKTGSHLMSDENSPGTFFYGLGAEGQGIWRQRLRKFRRK